jgi:hypothetical protein
MRVVRLAGIAMVLLAFSGVPSRAQNTSPMETILGISGKQKPAQPLMRPRELQEHVLNGKLVLSLDDRYSHADYADRLWANIRDRHEFSNLVCGQQELYR